MESRMNIPRIIVSSALLISTAGAHAVTLAESDFSASLDGWKTSPGDQWILRYALTGGNPGAYARGDDRAGNPSYYLAPSKYLGDWSGLNSNGNLSWDHATVVLGPNPTPFGMIPIARLSGPGGSAVFQFNVSGTVQGVWQHFSAPITQASWTVQSGSWAALLKNITALQINGEFISNGAPPGFEIWGLDNVTLTSTVPEIPTTMLLILGVAAFVAKDRRRRATKNAG